VTAHSRPAAWSVAEAKARFSEVVDRARSEGPQLVTRNGRDAAVIVSAEEWARVSEKSAQVKPKGSILEIFEDIRGEGLHVALDRMSGDFRETGLGGLE
jgi:prevent-host-death family protein